MLSFHSLLLFGTPGPTELIIIFVIVLLIFGGKKLPELARGLGKGIREFKKASNDIQEEIDNFDRVEARKSSPPPPPQTHSEPASDTPDEDDVPNSPPAG